MLSIGNRISDDTLEEGLEDTAGLFVDHGRDTLDTATAGETTNGGLGDALDVVAKDFAVALGAALPKTFTAFSTCIGGGRSVAVWCEWVGENATQRNKSTKLARIGRTRMDKDLRPDMANSSLN